MILIHQAIYGQGSDQGHSFLGSSYQNDSTPVQFSGYTDLVDRPQTGVLTAPIVRGFIVKDYFLLVKSFPDAQGRSGRVFSHALIIGINDYLKIKDISDLNRFHLSEINKEFVPEIIYYDNYPRQSVGEADLKMRQATYELINHLENKNTIAWVGGSEYWDWISRIWAQLPVDVKRNIRIGNAFNTRYVKEEQLNLLVISEGIKPNWLVDGYSVIDNPTRNNVDSSDSLCDYILGIDTRNSDVHKILTELKPEIIEIDDLKIFNKYAGLFANLGDRKSFRELFLLVNLVSRYNKDSNSSTRGKNKLIDALAAATTNASPEEFFSLQHQEWQGYDADYVYKKMGKAIDEWLDKNLLHVDGLNTKSKLAVSALCSGDTNMLFARTNVFISNSLNKWKKENSKIIWEWLVFDKSPVQKIVNLLPEIAQKDLTDTLPILDKKIVQILTDVLIKKGWFELLGMISIKTLPSQEALEKMLGIGFKMDLSILEKMTDEIPVEQFLKNACSIDSPYLLPIALSKLKERPSLRDSQDISNPVWQKIWAESSKQGLALWQGISEPQVRFYNVFDLLHEGQNVEVSLLKEMSRSNIYSLKDYENRSLIWMKIPSECREQFLVNTLIDCISEQGSNPRSLFELEKPLLDTLESPEVYRYIISCQDLSIEDKLTILESLHAFTENQAIELIEKNRFNERAANRLGVNVNNKRWKNVAKHIFSLRNSRPDLQEALANCKKQLNILELMSLSITGITTHQFSQDEYWGVFFEKAILLYPEGPNEHGLWERSGGRRSDLTTSGSGKEKWSRAINVIKNGGAPRISKIIEEMREDYPNDEILKNIKNKL